MKVFNLELFRHEISSNIQHNIFLSADTSAGFALLLRKKHEIRKFHQRLWEALKGIFHNLETLHVHSSIIKTMIGCKPLHT